MFRTLNWIVLVPVVLLIISLAYWGLNSCVNCEPKSTIEIIFAIIDIFRFAAKNYSMGRDPWQVVVAQDLYVAAVAITAVSAAFRLLLINLRRDFRVALATRRRDHVIVCGAGSTGRLVAENQVAAGVKV